MESLLLIPLSVFTKCVLMLLGWSLPTSELFSKITKNNRIVGVFSHTSYLDFYIMILYKLSYPNELKHVRTLVKPQPFEYAGWFLRKIGAIPSTRIEEKRGGAVTRIVSELKQNPKCLFLISPKGTIIKAEWRSGYFVIAKELDAELIAMGFDYEKKCIVVSEPISHNKGESYVKEYLQNQLSNIVPLFPEEEIIPIRQHIIAHRSVISNKRLTIIFGLMALIGYYLW